MSHNIITTIDSDEFDDDKMVYIDIMIDVDSLSKDGMGIECIHDMYFDAIADMLRDLDKD